jgi:hypothetical protein
LISGHGKIADKTIVTKYISYLEEVISISKNIREEGENIDTFVQKISLGPNLYIEKNINELMQGFHKWNILNSYKQLEE